MPHSEMTSPYLVGVARTDITPPVGVPLGGYGARTGVSDTVAAPLCCTAFVFRDAGTTVCIVSCDLLYVTADIADEARRQAEARTGIPRDAILLTATHTHSGPADLTWGADQGDRTVRFVIARIVEAIETAAATAVPATIRISYADLRGVSMNRRDPAGPIRTSVQTVAVERTVDRSSLAVLINYACHPTVLDADSLAISPDFPGAAASFVEHATGALAGYLQGCAGAINPVWIDHSQREVARIGSLLGAVVVRQVLAGQGVDLPRRSVNLSRDGIVETLPDPAAGEPVNGPIWYGARSARLRRRPTRRTADIDAEIAALQHSSPMTASGADAARRSSRLTALQAARFASTGAFPYWHVGPVGPGGPGGPGGPVGPGGDGGPGGPGVRGIDDGSDVVQVAALGFGNSLAFVGIPAEPFLEIDGAIRRRSHLKNLVVCGYANGMIGYVPSRGAFAAEGYEVGMARYTPPAAGLLASAAVAALGAGENQITARGVEEGAAG